MASWLRSNHICHFRLLFHAFFRNHLKSKQWHSVTFCLVSPGVKKDYSLLRIPNPCWGHLPTSQTNPTSCKLLIGISIREIECVGWAQPVASIWRGQKLWGRDGEDQIIIPMWREGILIWNRFWLLMIGMILLYFGEVQLTSTSSSENLHWSPIQRVQFRIVDALNWNVSCPRKAHFECIVWYFRSFRITGFQTTVGSRNSFPTDDQPIWHLNLFRNLLINLNMLEIPTARPWLHNDW